LRHSDLVSGDTIFPHDQMLESDKTSTYSGFIELSMGTIT